MVNLSGGRQLQRSIQDRKLGGVASGMAQYFDVSPGLMRLLWVVAVPVTGGLALLAYGILWALLPEGDVAPGEEHRFAADHARGRTAGVVLVALGLVVLASQTHIFHWIHFGFLWPLALLGLGLALLLRRA